MLNLLGGNSFAEPEYWPDYEDTVNVVDAAIAACFDAMVLISSVGAGPSSQWVPEESFLIPLLKLKTQAGTYLQSSALNSVILKSGGLGLPGENLPPAGKVLITENHGVGGLLPREDLAMTIIHVINKFGEQHFGKKLYVMADRINYHAGIPAEYTLSNRREHYEQ